jgi:polyhydroxybutyrate depolymerase
MLKRLFTALVFVLFVISLKAQTIVDSITSNGVTRHYRLYLPANYITGSVRPLIIHLHGYSSNALMDQQLTRYEPIADTAGFLVVFPEALKDNANYQCWNMGWPWVPNTHDVQFISDLIDSLHSTYLIDINRVYASGFSQGGFMTYTLACQLNTKIAAVASVSGSMAPDVFPCSPGRSVPTLQIHGTSDGIIPYSGSVVGSFTSVNIDTLMNFWINYDQCNPTPVFTALPDISPTDGSTVNHYVYSGGIDNASNELYKVIGADHLDWPGSGPGNNMDFNASQEIWRFFNQYTLDQFSGVNEIYPDDVITFYPNPSHSYIHIKSLRTGKVSITDMTGKILVSTFDKDVNVSSLALGFYLLKFETSATAIAKVFVIQ